MERVEKITLSRSMKISTAVFFVIILGTGIAVPLFVFLNAPWGIGIAIFIYLAILFGVILSLVFTLAPQKIVLDDTQFTMLRKSGKVSLPYSQMTDIQMYQRKGQGIVIRRFGIGGVLGDVGSFYNKKLGKYTAYVGDYSQAFVIDMKNGKKYMFSCENAPQVVEMVKEKIAAGEGQ